MVVDETGIKERSLTDGICRLGPKGIARMRWPIYEANRDKYMNSFIEKKRKRPPPSPLRARAPTPQLEVVTVPVTTDEQDDQGDDFVIV